ncbi:hypothetical protein [Nocardia fluminea]|uniref:hypothetical protein n=1 Tax=Nocardia fluminea TaxID=134984 RepID=UPI0034005ED7
MTQFSGTDGIKAVVRWESAIREGVPDLKDGVPEYVELTIYRETCEVEVQIKHGKPTRVTFSGEVHTTDLRAITLDTWVYEALSRVAVEPHGEGEFVRHIRPFPTSVAREIATQAQAGLPERHRKVAEVYLSGGYIAVAQHFSISRRAAMSYVDDARSAGYELPRRPRGRPKREQ